MTQGERIKYIRTQRGLTQKELGALCDFSENTADVRIRQYESNAKAPKKETLLLLAKALKVNPLAIKNYDLSSSEDIMETLFWLDTNETIDIFALLPKRDVKSDWRLQGNYNSNVYRASDCTTYGLVFHDELVNKTMGEWSEKKDDLKHTRITNEEYNNWKWNWPYEN